MVGHRGQQRTRALLAEMPDHDHTDPTSLDDAAATARGLLVMIDAARADLGERGHVHPDLWAAVDLQLDHLIDELRRHPAEPERRPS